MNNKILFRIWLICAIGWFIAAALYHSIPLAGWAGYHYSLYMSSGSLLAAIADKQSTENVIASCEAADASVCQSVFAQRPHEDPFNLIEAAKEHDALLPSWRACLGKPQFLDALRREAASRNISPDQIVDGSACIDFINMRLPHVHWIPLLIVLLAPLVALASTFGLKLAINRR